MARYKARLSRDAGGGWIAAAVELPNCWSRGRDPDEAVAKLRDEIRYRIEYCPCSGVTDDYVEVEVTPAAERSHTDGAAVRRAVAGRGVNPGSGATAPETAPEPAPAPARRVSRWRD